MSEQATLTIEETQKKAAEAIAKRSGKRELGGGKEGKEETPPNPAFHKRLSRSYSYGLAMGGARNNRFGAGSPERDLHDVLCERAQLDPDSLLDEGKILVPHSMKRGIKLLQRANNTWDDKAAGALINEQAGEIIDLLRHELVLTQAGVRDIELPPGGLSWPKQTGSTVGYWVDEEEEITASQISMGKLNLTPRKVAVLTVIPNEALNDTEGRYEELVRQDIANGLAEKEEHAFFFGTGGGAQPLGLNNDKDVAKITSFGALTVDTMQDKLMKALENSKGKSAKADFILPVNGKWKLIRERTGMLNSSDVVTTTTGNFLLVTDPADPTILRLLGSRIISTTNISGTDPEDIVAYGQWDTCVIGRTEALEIATDAGPGFIKDQMYFRATERVNMGSLRPALVKIGQGVTF